MSMEQFVLFGDSITQQSASQAKGFAWTPALQDAYIRRLDVINRGFSGYNTTQALSVLPRVLPTPEQGRIRLMTIFLGANDARLPNTPGFSQTVDLEQYKSNLTNIINHPTLQAHEPQLILLTPPPIEERKALAHDKTNGINVMRRTASNTAKYAEAVRQLGKEFSLPVLDVWAAFMKEAGWKEGDPLPGSSEIEQNQTLANMLHDGLHLNPEGYEIIYRELMKLITDKLPEHAPDNIPYVLPSWDNAEAWK
ncbi:GDSL lipase/acylhydrolase family protein [Aureobasidium pullulans]|uniref:GDSL lipase/acylhydrolase family protein n=1 Tax=Aureobasidium pullulans TaxID=5580 RepID=A0A4T0BZM9_AURPU|nr:GDSL lipase/acylhydrolase family protein [Aureobasidium pullulans]